MIFDEIQWHSSVRDMRQTHSAEIRRSSDRGENWSTVPIRGIGTRGRGTSSVNLQHIGTGHQCISGVKLVGSRFVIWTVRRIYPSYSHRT